MRGLHAPLRDNGRRVLPQAASSSHAGKTEMNRCIMSINRHLRKQAHTVGSYGRRVTLVKKIIGIRLSSCSILPPQRRYDVCLITTLCYLCITLQATFAPHQHAHVASFSVQQHRLILEAKKETWATQIKIAMWTDLTRGITRREKKKKKKSPATQFSYCYSGHNTAYFRHILPSQTWLTHHTHKLCPVLAHFPTATSSCRVIIKPLYGKW